MTQKFRFILFAALAFTLLPGSTFALNKKVPKHIQEKKTDRPPFGPDTDQQKMFFRGAIGPSDYYSGFGFSIHGGGEFKITKDQPLYIGFETGFDIFASYNYTWVTGTGATTSYVALPVLAAAMYRTEIPKVRGLHPYGSLVVGPSFALSSGRSLVFEIATGPGVDWKFNDNWAVHGEVRVGILGGNFLFSPSVGMTAFIM